MHGMSTEVESYLKIIPESSLTFNMHAPSESTDFAFSSCDVNMFMSVFPIPHELTENEEIEEDRAGTSY